MGSNSRSKRIADKMIVWLRSYAAANIDSLQIDEQGSFPPHVFLDLGNQGFFGIHVSHQYGGLELQTSDKLRLIEQVAAIDLTLALVLIESIQGAHTLEKYATKSMKELYLPQVAAGRIFTAGAMTESEAGSNPRAMKSVAVFDGNAWLLHGSKRWVGLGSSAAVTAIYVNQVDPEHNWQGMTAFLVPQGTKGLSIGPDAPMMGLRGFSRNTIHMDDLKVTHDHLLGQPGEGMEIAQDNMMYVRLFLAAAAIGAMKRSIQLMLRYAQRRIIATGLLLDNPVTLVHLSEMTAVVTAIDNFVSVIAHFCDENASIVPEESLVVSKVLGAEYLDWIVDRLVQMLGARGYEEASGVSKMYRDARAFRVFEGPTEALNMYVGSRALVKNPMLEAFVSETLQQKQLFLDMQSVVDRISHYALAQKQTLFDKPFVAVYWIQALVGEVISYGLLMAGLTYQLQQQQSKDLDRAYKWVKDKYDLVVQKALGFSLGEEVLMPTNDLQDLVANYSKSIGSVEQVRQSDGKSVDHLLKAIQEVEPNSCCLEMKHKLFLNSLWHPEEEDQSSAVFTDIVSQEAILQLSHNKMRHKAFPELCVHQIFSAQVALRPDSIALVYQDKHLSYSELERQSNQVANALIAAGISGDKLVAIYVERSIEMIVGLLGILKSGGVYLPLDYNYPEKNLTFMFEDSGAEMLLAQRKLAADVSFDAKKIIVLEDVLEDPAANDEPVLSTVSLDNIGYVMYTSGSTGYPKGVKLPHRALSNLIYWHLHQIKGKRNVLQFATLNFDMSFIEIFSAFGSGGTLTLISEQDRLDLFEFARIVKSQAIQHLVVPVPFLKSLAEAHLDTDYFQSLKEVIVAGEQLVITPAILSFFKQIKACKLMNYYGPAETHVVTSFTYPNDKSNWPDYAPIGQAIYNTKILVLNDEQQLLPTGSAGEIYVGGAALASGYINRSELTHERFIPDPWGETPNALLYRTGDFGKYLDDGQLVYLGRKDEQVKIRGFRIELQEIELHLIKHPAVKEVAVITKKSVLLDKHLEAFIVTDSEVNNSFIDDIFSFLREHLPSHMLPSKFNIIKHMPWTNSGKINRNALEELECPVTYSIDSIAEPDTETEKELVGLMEDIFELKLGTNSSFISVGGNSLLAMHIVSALRDKFAVEIPAHSILSAPTIAHTAKRIDDLLLVD
ncbi:MAG: amino acid adenylation domain-containing protein [Gammaproteobacteria bacterium]|nr:amino acid adenylation domain-containing protein [Gammaproteobacteria bacterium]